MKIAIVGSCGHWGPALTEASARGGVEFVACAPGSIGVDMTNVQKRAEELTGKLPVYYEDYLEMIRTEQPDVVIVDNFYGEHTAVSIAALEAGCHVYSEKPVATTLEELETLKAVQKKSGKEFTAMLNYRYYGSFRLAHELIEAGKIGEVRLLNGQKSYKFGATRPDFYRDRRTYGGTLAWVGIHAIDWIRWMSGKEFTAVTAVDSSIGNRGYGTMELTALAQYQLEDGVMASLTVDYCNPANAPLHGDDRIRVVGTEGVLEVRGHSLTLINADAPGIQNLDVPEDGMIFADFLDQIEGKGTCLVSTEDAFAATEAALRAQLSADENRPVTF